jgi:hypothetical protein
MSEQYHRNVIEAGLLAAGKSLTLAELAQLFDEAARPPATELRAALETLAADYAGRALELRETASGFRVQVRRDVAAEVAPVWAAAALLAHCSDGADRLPPADHARRDRVGARRRGESEHRQDAAGAQLDPRRRPSRPARPAGAARHDARIPRLFRPAHARRAADPGAAALAQRHRPAADAAGGRHAAAAEAARATRPKTTGRHARTDDDSDGGDTGRRLAAVGSAGLVAAPRPARTTRACGP